MLLRFDNDPLKNILLQILITRYPLQAGEILQCYKNKDYDKLIKILNDIR